MKTKVVIETRIENAKDELYFGYEVKNDWIFVNPRNKESVEEAAKNLNISIEAVIAIAKSFEAMNEYLVDLMAEDLQDVWKKVLIFKKMG
jgi:hypothetical protein